MACNNCNCSSCCTGCSNRYAQVNYGNCGCNSCSNNCGCSNSCSSCGTCGYGTLRTLSGPFSNCGNWSRRNFPFYTGPCGPCDPCNSCGTSCCDNNCGNNSCCDSCSNCNSCNGCSNCNGCNNCCNCSSSSYGLVWGLPVSSYRSTRYCPNCGRSLLSNSCDADSSTTEVVTTRTTTAAHTDIQPLVPLSVHSSHCGDC